MQVPTRLRRLRVAALVPERVARGGLSRLLLGFDGLTDQSLGCLL